MRESDKEKFRNKIFPYFLSWDLEALLFSSLHQKSDSQATPPLTFYFNILLKLYASRGMQQTMPPSSTSICLLDLYGFPEAAILIGNGFFSPCYFNIPTENAQRWQDPTLTPRFCLTIPFIYFFPEVLSTRTTAGLFTAPGIPAGGDGHGGPQTEHVRVPGVMWPFPSQMGACQRGTASAPSALARRETLSQQQQGGLANPRPG